jgi:hypothetical protein
MNASASERKFTLTSPVKVMSWICHTGICGHWIDAWQSGFLFVGGSGKTTKKYKKFASTFSAKKF